MFVKKITLLCVQDNCSPLPEKIHLCGSSLHCYMYRPRTVLAIVQYLRQQKQHDLRLPYSSLRRMTDWIDIWSYPWY